MTLLLKNGAVFLHIPRTGGSWVTNLLDEMNLIESRAAKKHGGFGQLSLALQQTKPFTFCFIRNPLSWYESWFRYQVGKGWLHFGSKKEWHPCRPLNGLGSNDFNRFISNVLEIQPGFLAKMYQAYTGDCSAVGKQENLVEDLIRILETMDVDFDKTYVRDFDKVVNGSPKTTVLWDNELRDRLLFAEAEAFTRNGYSE